MVQLIINVNTSASGALARNRAPVIVRVMKTVVAAYCYSGKGEKHRIAIVTSSTGRWIIPKGHVEKGMKNREVALMEVWEESGIIGIIAGKPQEFIIDRGDLALWKVYPVKIRRVEEKWPESRRRQRKLVSPEEALELIDDGDLADAVKKLAKKFRKK